ncbi:9657_t:CDS:2 [Funneliformis mosseae]|uniref:9657_t:CDS:1 n=1 Tax=Funneliformis mosseae TaxID=27381 RepID=A0A9N9D969_FUNMO|nr:9657_t:CDS:2 [Funneliformis mosseae]
MSEKRLKLAAQGLRKTAISLQAAVVSLLQAAEALTSETDDSLVDNNPLDINLQDLLKGNINGALSKLFGDALNNEGETLDKDQKAQQNDKQPANGVKRSTRKPRPPRDPNAPTKPQNAFILFQKDVANSVKAENQGKPWSEIVYEHQYEAAKQRFEIEYKAYMETKDQETASPAADVNGHEESNNTSSSTTPNSTPTTPPSSDDDDETNLPTKTRSAHEVEENEKSTKRSKKRTSNDEEHRKIKKHSRDEKSKEDFDVGEEIKYEREDGVGDEFESSSKTSKNKKRNKKTKKI